MDESKFESLSSLRRIVRESIHEAERAAAQGALTKLLTRYGLVDSDLDSEIRESEYIAMPNTDIGIRLGFQILAKFSPEGYKSVNRKPAMRRKRMVIYEAKLTKAELAEISSAIIHYYKDYFQQSATFYSAYLHLHGLMIQSDDVKPIDPKELEELLRKVRAINHNPNLKRLEEPAKVDPNTKP